MVAPFLGKYDLDTSVYDRIATHPQKLQFGDYFNRALAEMVDPRLGWDGLCHGDCRVDNYFFPGGDTVGMIDFQLMRRSTIVADVANAMGSSQPVEIWEGNGRDRMLNIYFSAVAKAGYSGLLSRANAKEEFVEMIALFIFFSTPGVWLLAVTTFDKGPEAVETLTMKKMITNYEAHFDLWEAEQVFERYLNDELIFQRRLRDMDMQTVQ